MSEEVKQKPQSFYQDQFQYTLQNQKLKRRFSYPLLSSQFRLQSNQLDQCFTELNKDIKKQNEITIK